jgi:hypothetical protein
MIEGCCSRAVRSALALEARRGRGLARQDLLQRHNPSEPHVLRLPHPTHAAPGDLRAGAVMVCGTVERDGGRTTVAALESPAMRRGHGVLAGSAGSGDSRAGGGVAPRFPCPHRWPSVRPWPPVPGPHRRASADPPVRRWVRTSEWIIGQPTDKCGVWKLPPRTAPHLKLDIAAEKPPGRGPPRFTPRLKPACGQRDAGSAMGAHRRQ